MEANGSDSGGPPSYTGLHDLICPHVTLPRPGFEILSAVDLGVSAYEQCGVWALPGTFSLAGFLVSITLWRHRRDPSPGAERRRI